VTASPVALAPQAPATGSWAFDDDAVRFAIGVLDDMDIMVSLRQWRVEERERLGRHAGGAPERFPTDALMVAMILAAVHHRPLHLRTFRDILFRHISPAMRAQLGVPNPPDPDDRLGWEALERCVRTRFHGLLEAIDPSPLPKNRILDAGAFDAAVAQLKAQGATRIVVIGHSLGANAAIGYAARRRSCSYSASLCRAERSTEKCSSTYRRPAEARPRAHSGCARNLRTASASA